MLKLWKIWFFHKCQGNFVWKILALRCNATLENFCLNKLVTWAKCCEDNGTVYSKKTAKIYSKGCCMIWPYGIFNKTVKHDPRFILIYLCLMDRDTSFTFQEVCLLRIQQPKMSSHILNAGVLTIIRSSIIKITRLIGSQDHYFKVISLCSGYLHSNCVVEEEKKVTKL